MTTTEQLSLTGKEWVLPRPALDQSLLTSKRPAWVGHLLHQRGFRSEEEIASYLDTSLQNLEDPGSIADMDKAVERLGQAISLQEPIVVYGDYDVDGVCSATILVEFLTSVGAEVDYYIPNRQSEGYGVNEEAIESIAQRAAVLITTDCGITAVEPLRRAQELGLDAIVVDHHQVPAQLPPAVALLDPHRADCQFPFKGLCAAGVAFMLIAALRRHLRDTDAFSNIREPDIRVHLDAVALATVADMVPIQGTNRILVAAGLRLMAQNQRPGLAALMKVSQIEPSEISTSALGYRIGPRINARGRLDHAGLGVELMLTQDPAKAMELAEVLDQANLSRRELEGSTVESALKRVDNEKLDSQASIVLYDPTWHPGVLGLVASRIALRFCRPTIVIGEGGKGSARSIEGVNIYDAMAAGQEYTIRFGGHHAAAGLTIAPDQIPAFHQAFEQSIRSQKGAPPFIATLKPDLEVNPELLNLDMVDELETLSPFGQTNPEPLFLVQRVAIRSKRVVGKTHLKLTLGKQAHDAIAFGFAEHLNAIGNHVDAIFKIERNSFRGKESLQLKIEDLRPCKN